MQIGSDDDRLWGGSFSQVHDVGVARRSCVFQIGSDGIADRVGRVSGAQAEMVLPQPPPPQDLNVHLVARVARTRAHLPDERAQGHFDIHTLPIELHSPAIPPRSAGTRCEFGDSSKQLVFRGSGVMFWDGSAQAPPSLRPAS